MTRQTVSACLIVRNEQERLPEALRSVAFCDEVVVVDSGSVDGTVALARRAGALVVEHPWEGFARQRNLAIDHARGDWILELDADERVSPELAREILTFLAGPPPDGTDLCGLPRRERFCGAWLGPAAKYPNYRHRLFRRGAYRHDEQRLVHEGISPRAPVWPLRGELEHHLADGWHEALRDAWVYARLESAQAPPQSGAGAYARAILVRPAAKLVYRLVIDGGWRDGARGVARIALECTSDSIVMLRRALSRAPAQPAGQAADGHFGRLPRAGPVRIVAVAHGAHECERALRWLEAACAAGADVALIADSAEAGNARLRSVKRLGPLALIRAVEAESQLRAIDLVVAGPGRAGRLARLIPPMLRGGRRPSSLADDPSSTVARIAAVSRWPP